jgi:hypothetical protein
VIFLLHFRLHGLSIRSVSIAGSSKKSSSNAVDITGMECVVPK